MAKKQIVLKLNHISKRFGKVFAVDDADLTLYKGEILAILGENGSGKTSLMNVIEGIYFPDSGTITVKGKKAIIHSPHDAFQHRIGMVHQHFKLVDIFSGIDNVLLGYKNKPYHFKEKWREISKKRQKAIKAICVKYHKEKTNTFTSRCLKWLKFTFRKFLTWNKFVPAHYEVTARKIGNVIGYMHDARGKEAYNIAKRYGFDIDLKKRVSDMSVSEKQTVEIIKTLYRGVDILILDEPTAVLTPQEIETFFNILRKMKKDGKSIIIITHKLNEVMAISDRVAILRKGKVVSNVETNKTNEQSLTNLMVGKKVVLKIERKKMKNVEPRLYVNNLTYIDKETGKKALDDINFTVKSGEILGIAGVAGSGQKELLEVLSGIQDCEVGSLVYYHPKKDKPVTLFHKSLKRVMELARIGMFYYRGTRKKVDFKGMKKKDIVREIDNGNIIFSDDEIINVKGLSPRELKDLGIRSSFVPEDRLGMGLIANMDIVDNMMLRNYRKGPLGLLNHDIPSRLSREVIQQLEVKTPNLHTQISKLSGGNIQKLLVGREISSSPYVLIAAYPVRGLDINSSYAIYNLLNKQKEKGCAIIFVGEDLDVMLALCDRIIVMSSGRVTGEVDARKTTKEKVGHLMTLSNQLEGGAR